MVCIIINWFALSKQTMEICMKFALGLHGLVKVCMFQTDKISPDT